MIGPNFADLDHHPQFGPSVGSILPPLDTHPKIYSWEHQRFAVTSELYSALGVDMKHGLLCGNRSLSPLATLIPELPLRKRMQIAGNGMHVPMMAAWFVYVLARCVRVEAFYTMSQQVSLAATSPRDDDVFEDPDA